MTTSIDKMMAALNAKGGNSFNRTVHKIAPKAIKGGTAMPGTKRGAKGGPAGKKIGPGYIGEKPLAKGKFGKKAGKTTLGLPSNPVSAPKNTAGKTANLGSAVHVHIHLPSDNDGDEGGY